MRIAGWLAMVKVYVDESGIHEGSAHCIVGGYRGSEQQWKDFQRRWLADGCQTEFHATEFFRRDQRGHRLPPYDGWDNAKAKSYLDCRLDAINRTNIFPIGAVIDVGYFNSLTEHERRHLTGGESRDGKWRVSGAPKKAYFLPFQDVVIQAVEAVQRVGWKAHFYFDENNQFSSFARELYTIIKRGSPPEISSRMGDLTFASSSDTAGLQAADLFTYVWYQYTQRRRSLKPEILTIFDALKERGTEVHYFSAETMGKLLGKAVPTEGRTIYV